MDAPNSQPAKLSTALEHLPDEVKHGIELFNHRDFIECHHVLQQEWYREHDPVRLLYQGIVQIGAAALHVQRGHWKQALTLFERAKPKLDLCPPLFLGVNVERLAQDARHCEELVRDLGPDGLPQCDLGRFPVIELQSSVGELTQIAN
jgi:hypothetical protein